MTSPEIKFRILFALSQYFLCHATSSAYNEFAGQQGSLLPQHQELGAHYSQQHDL